MGDASRQNPGGGALELCQLPAECLSSVFSKLESPRDICNASIVCRQWRVLVPSSVTRLSLSHKMGLSQDTLIRVLASYPAVTDLRLPCMFSGVVYGALLQGVARSCPRLTSLDASGFGLQNFPFSSASVTTLLDACPRLQRLKLGTQGTTDIAPGPALWLAPAPPRPHLRSLTLERCSLPDPRSIPLTHVSHIQNLCLRECSFPERASRAEAVSDITALFTLVGQLTGLQKLQLWLLDNNNARLTVEDGDGERLWLRKLGRLSVLQSLTLCGMWQTPSLPVSWPRCLPSLRTLRLLRLVHFSNMDTVLALKGLTKLAISQCEALSLPQEVSQLTRLSALAFTHSDVLREVPASLGRLSSLTLLDLTSCPELRTLPSSLCSLSALRMLCLSACQDLRALPPTLGMLTQLKLLDISECSRALATPVALRQVGTLKIVEQQSIPTAPSLWSPLDPTLQLHPAVRRMGRRSHAAVDEMARVLGLRGEWEEWEDDHDMGEFGFGDMIELVGDEDMFDHDEFWEADQLEGAHEEDGGFDDEDGEGVYWGDGDDEVIELLPEDGEHDDILEIENRFHHLGEEAGEEAADHGYDEFHEPLYDVEDEAALEFDEFGDPHDELGAEEVEAVWHDNVHDEGEEWEGGGDLLWENAHEEDAEWQGGADVDEAGDDVGFDQDAVQAYQEEGDMLGLIYADAGVDVAGDVGPGEVDFYEAAGGDPHEGDGMDEYHAAGGDPYGGDGIEDNDVAGGDPHEGWEEDYHEVAGYDDPADDEHWAGDDGW